MISLTGLIKYVNRRKRKVGWSTVEYFEVVIQTESGWKTLTFEGESLPRIAAIRPDSLMRLDYLTDGSGKIIRLRSADVLTGPEFTPLRQTLADKPTSPPPDLSEQPLPQIPRLTQLVETVQNPTAKGILHRALQVPDFYTHQAALGMHHAYEGGLLRHSIGVAESALGFADQLKKQDLSFNLSSAEREAFQRSQGTLVAGTPINKDVLIAGALLHDIGKLKEYSKRGSEFSVNPGEHLYHTTSGQNLIEGWANSLPAADFETVNLLNNIVASHHVQELYRARDIRRSPEALLVSMADSYDTKVSKEAEYLHQEYLQTLENLAKDTSMASDIVRQKMESARDTFEAKANQIINKPGGGFETSEDRARRLRRFPKK